MGSPTTDFDVERHVAFHEAAHAVAQVRFEFACTGVTINPDEDYLGVTQALDGWDTDADGNVLHGEEYVIMTLAGYAAAVRVDPEHEASARRGAGEDFEHAARLIRYIDSEAREPVPDRWISRAKGWVAENWTAIEAVALQLLEHRALDDCEVECIVEVADGVGTEGDLEEYRARRDYFMKP